MSLIPSSYRLMLRTPHAALVMGSSVAINLLALALPLMTIQIYDRVMISRAADTLLILSAGVLVAALAECLLRLLRQTVTSRTAARFDETMSSAALAHLLAIEPRRQASKTTTVRVQDINAVQRLKEYYGGQMTATLLVDIPFAVLFLVLTFYLTGPLVFVTVGGIAIAILMFVRHGRALRDLTAARERHDDRRHTFASQALQALPTIKAMCWESDVAQRYDDLQRAGAPVLYRLACLQSASGTFGYLGAQIMVTALMGVGAVLAVKGMITGGMLAAGIMLSGQILQHVQRGAGLWLRWQDINVAAQRLATIMKLETRRVEPGAILGPVPLKLQQAQLSFGACSPVIDKLSLTVMPGEAIAITGPAGCGKTALLELMAGLYAPDSGRVLLGGVDASQLTDTARAQAIGYLPTRGLILRGTIMDNITGFQDRPPADVRLLATALGIESAVALLPAGYETQLDNTISDAVSPGLKQRIAIARVLLQRPRAGLFDNAGQGLDRSSYASVFSMLMRLRRNVTLVLVTEDQNILGLADRIYELRHGVLTVRHAGVVAQPALRYGVAR
ncbi:MAG: ATP-binding cassette domain-containing protein [Bdellovibrionales bacterium]